MELSEVLSFYKNKRVLVTGHTGFKGTWLCRILAGAGAEVTGFALRPKEPSLFAMAGLEGRIGSVFGDIRDLGHLQKAFQQAEPEIVFHLAAQPLVRESYQNPVGTYGVNVMGAVHVCECIRASASVKSFVNVTTDKVYCNMEWEWGYREDDRLGGYDPYSSSKSCSELVTQSYKDSFFRGMGLAVSAVRAGNVVGGGDFAENRIVPDCVRAAMGEGRIIVRNPKSVRPYQHVLEPLAAYLMIAAEQYKDRQYEGSYNVGPREDDCVTTGELAELFCKCWGDGVSWESCLEEGPHEASFLKLDCARMKQVFGWEQRWNIEEAIANTVAWTKAWLAGQDMAAFMDKQIEDFL
mgnify:CR=1 FL=1